MHKKNISVFIHKLVMKFVTRDSPWLLGLVILMASLIKFCCFNMRVNPLSFPWQC